MYSSGLRNLTSKETFAQLCWERRAAVLTAAARRAQVCTRTNRSRARRWTWSLYRRETRWTESPAASWRKRTHSPPWTQGSWANTRRATVCTKHKTFAKLKPCCYGSLTRRLSLWRRARKSPPSHSGAWLVGSGRRGNENVTGASETGHHPTSCMMGQVPGRSFYFILHTFHTGITSFTCIFHDF